MAHLVPRVPIPTGHSFGELLQLEPEKFIKKNKRQRYGSGFGFVSCFDKVLATVSFVV